MKSRALMIMVAALVLSSPVAGQAPPVQGVVANVTKNQTGDTGTISVTVNGNTVTYQVSEGTTFQYNNQVSTWGANFLNVTVGKNVAVAPGPGKSAAVVQILLPAPPPPPPPGPPGPPPPPPKPSRVHGIVTAIDPGGVVTIKLPNRTPPPPVQGRVLKVALDQYKGHGFITVQPNGQKYPQLFMVTAWTRFTKMGVQMQNKQATQVQWHETFLSIDKREQVKVFPRYGAPGLAQTVDILLKGATPPPAIILPDHFLQFHLQVGTTFETVRSGSPMMPASPKSLALGQEVGILPAAIHSPLAADVHIRAPKAVQGTLVHVGANNLTVTVSKSGGKGQPSTAAKITVPVHRGTSFVVAQGSAQKAAHHSALQHGQKLQIFPGAAPPHAADLVIIHPLSGKGTIANGKPQTVNGVLVGATPAAVMVKTGNSVKTFTLNGTTKLEAVQGKNRRPAHSGDFVPGAKVTVTALNAPPHLANHVQIHVANVNVHGPVHQGKITPVKITPIKQKKR